MKNGYKYSLIAVSMAVLVLSCQKNPEPKAPEENSNSVTLTCAFPTMSPADETKVSLADDGTTQWQVGDKIVIYGKTASEKVVHTIVAGDITDPKKAVFTVDLTGVTPSEWGYKKINVAYPYDEGNVPFTASDSDDSGRARFHNTNQLLMAGYVDDDNSIRLYNLNAAIMFKVSGDFDAYYFMGANGTETVGYSDYLCEMNKSTPVYRKKYLQSNGTAGPLTRISGTILSNDGTNYNYIYLPVNNSDAAGDDATAVSLPNGFSILFLKEGVIKKIITSTAALTIAPGHFINLGTLPAAKIHDYEAIPASEKASAMELSNPKSANCYVVDGGDDANKDKVFKFPAVKGNTYVSGGAAGTSVGEVVSVDIVWETWNNAESVTANSVIKVVDYKDGFVYFKMPSTLHAGNALIAAKDAGHNILWSWHIWVPETEIANVDAGFAAAGTIMDRNLGALIAMPTNGANVKALGMYYQWGRKDPLCGTKIQGTPSSAMRQYVSGAAADYDTSIQNPTVFYYIESSNWLSTNVTTLWDEGEGKKTQYDPCPPGYKVPVFDATYPMWNKDGAAFGTNWTWDGSNAYAKYSSATAAFPLGGYLNGTGQGESGFGSRAEVWSATPASSSRGNGMLLRDSAYNAINPYKSQGGNVRCVAE